MKMKSVVAAVGGAVFAVAGCSAADEKVETTANAPGKVLIAYYSYSGNTKYAAEQIQKAVGGELFEIRPAKAYPADYNACVAQAKQECASGNRPELAGPVKDIGSYDVIFIGTPNWWSTMAPPVLSFLAGRDFRGKTVIPFVTHGGGGMARCEADIRKACSNAAFGKGGAFSGSSVKNSGGTIAKWAISAMPPRK